MDGEYYTEEGEPIKCCYCDCEHLYEMTKDIVQHTVAEYAIVCHSCNEVVGYWAYGYFDPFFKEIMEAKK